MQIKNYLSLFAIAFLGSFLALSTQLQADELQDARQLFKQGDYSKSFSKINAYLERKPNDAHGRFLKGVILTEQGKSHEAIKVFVALSKDYPSLPEPYNNLAVIYASQNQYDKAKSALETAIRTHPSYATAHENLGDIYAKLASQAYAHALQLDNNKATTQTKLSLIQNIFSVTPDTVVAETADATNKSPLEPTQTPVANASTKPLNATEIQAPNTTIIPAGKAQPIATVATNIAGNPSEIHKTLNAWAAAWAARNVNKYLSFYAADFKTPKNESRANWEASRHDRISNAKHIEVNLANVTVVFGDSSHATVKFQQTYRSNSFKARDDKTIAMIKVGNNWLIQEEFLH
jgi:tetratricopeptide (TPR) repeat protein